MTITVIGETEAALDTEVARIRGIAHQNGMRLVREVTALEAASSRCIPATWITGRAT